MKKYKVDFLTYTSDNFVKSNCGDITFVNGGTNTVVINDSLKLFSGSSLSLSANENEIDETTYSFRFLGLPGAGNLLTVLRKIFI